MRALIVLLSSCVLAPAATAADPAAARSPFSAPGKTEAAPADSSAPFEFTGLFTAGGTTMVAVTATADKRSRWIAVGAQADGIRVASHDAEAQRIVVEHGGRSYTLALKRSVPRPGHSNVSGVVPLGPLPVAQAAEPVPLTDAEKEREARFLVSDLLEIGMVQRKAYEEAQRKAGGGKAETPGPVPSPQPTPPPKPQER